jgi:RNA polymerase sigma-70 factor (ECF subfamily)|tara:strand:- start:674 stop:1324 length:651 start_codon:yes stop_codon:yes gene_type:complete
MTASHEKKITPDIEKFESVDNLSDPKFLTELRVMMLKFAKLQLSDEALAEDAVQDALIGALKNTGKFERRSALKTWVFAILKNKIADILRKNQKYVQASSLLNEDQEEDNMDQLFNDNGRWHKNERPVSWGSPHESVKQDHFWRVFETCLHRLPENQARLFMMREFVQLEANEICESLDISTSNLHVMLYRARLRLRECLENKWFLKGESTEAGIL